MLEAKTLAVLLLPPLTLVELRLAVLLTPPLTLDRSPLALLPPPPLTLDVFPLTRLPNPTTNPPNLEKPFWDPPTILWDPLL